MKDTLLNRSRFTGTLFEAFTESQASIRIQLSYYLALCIVFSQPIWDFSKCIAESVIGDTNPFLKFNEVIFLSSLASLLSLTFAQFNLYQKKHEFDISFKGSILYFLGSLFTVFSKLSCQILFTTVFYVLAITTIDRNLWWLRWLYFIIPNVLIDVLHLWKERLVNTKSDGYFLSLKFFPTTSDIGLQLDHWRFQKISDKREKGKATPYPCAYAKWSIEAGKLCGNILNKT